jgi:hypothetical protein
VWELIVRGSSGADFESRLSQTRSTGARGADAEGSSPCQTSMIGSSIALVLSRSDSFANSSGTAEYLGRIELLRNLGPWVGASGVERLQRLEGSGER